MSYTDDFLNELNRLNILNGSTTKKTSSNYNSYTTELLTAVQQNSKKKKKKEEWGFNDLGIITRLDLDDDDEEEDIAPVKDDGGLDFFQKGVFEDGYQFGDVTKTILGTAGDAGLGVVKGFAKTAEGVADLLGYGLAGAADLLGNHEYAESVRMTAQEDAIGSLTEGADDYLNKYSLLGRTSDAVMEGIGQIGAIIGTGGMGSAAGLSTAGVTALTTGTMGLSGMGSGMGEAYQGGATDEEALTYGAISGAADALSELMFGGLGKMVKATGLSVGLTSGDDILAKKVSNLFSSQLTKNFAEFGVKAGAEGFEEFVAGTAQAVGKKLTYMSEEELSDIIKDENLLEQFVVGAVTSGMIQSGMIPGTSEGSLKESIQQDKDFITGLSQNEQAVVKKEVEKRIAEREKDGKKLTTKEKNAIEEQVTKDLDKGYISIDTIEEVLGGEDYVSYNNAATSEKSTLEAYEQAKAEYDTLYDLKYGEKSDKQVDRQSELKKWLDEMQPTVDQIKKNPESAQFKSSVSEKVFGLAKDSRLVESYNERTRRGQTFEADLTKYDAKQQETIKKAIESGVLNNTNRTHEFVDLVAKISADKGVLFDFTNNAKLKESGFAVDGKAVNGYVTKDGITLNIESPKALKSTVGHEISHVLEGTDLYTELQTAVFEYAKSKNDYQGRYDALTKLYENIEGADVNAELTADLVGDYLFTDDNFIRNLSTQHRNVFQKIYDEVKYLLKVATAGSKEARELEKVKRAFEKAYRQGGEVQSDTKYSVTKITPSEIQPVNEVSDKGKFDYLVSEFKETGWNGRPMVVVRNGNGSYIAMTGSHRLYAASEAGIDVQAVVIDYTPDIDPLMEVRSDEERSVVAQELYEDGIISKEAFDLLKREDELNFENYGVPYKEQAKYSISDSDGKQLSKEQQEYFKDSKARDENGNLLVVYHGTPRGGFNEFRHSEIGTTSDYGYLGRGFYFTPRERVAEYYAGYLNTSEVKSGYVNITNPLTIPSKRDLAFTLESIMGHRFDGENANYKRSVAFTEWLEENGYDGVICGDEIMVLNSNQFKNADNTNPTESPDIRYSISDSDGKKLTKEQQDYFKDSKVRDENGNLLVVYHGSPNEFTVFRGKGNSRFGEYKFMDHTVNYFTTSKVTAEDYSTKSDYTKGSVYGGYVNITNPYTFKDESEGASERGYSTANGLKNRELREFQISLFDKYLFKLKFADSVEEVNEMLLPFNARVKVFEEVDGDITYELFAGGGNTLFASENFVESADDFYDLFYDKELLNESILGISEEYGDDDYYFTTDIVVNLVIAMNKANGTTYDGIIIDNIFDAPSYHSEVAMDVITIESPNQFKSADNREPTIDDDIRYSLSDSEGNNLTEEQQEYFKDSKIKDANGNLLKVYHGTTNNFTTFRQGIADGWGKGIYFTDNKEEASTYGGNVVEAYLNITNPYNADTMSYYDIGAEQTQAYRDFDTEVWRKAYEEYDSYEEYKADGNGADMHDIYRENVEVFNKILRELGYDGIIADGSNGIDGLEIVAFRENQPKLTSNKTPTSDPDIRYSLSDSDGRNLSSEQREYFKDSAVRDENGNLKVMYHGTSAGGHTIFDTYGSKYGLFGAGSYFTDNRDIAESYTEKGSGKSKQIYETYLNITNPMDMDAEAIPSEWAKAFPEAQFPDSGTNEEFFRAMEEYFYDEMMSKWEVADEVMDAIEFMGYDGITHIGGGRVRADGTRHRVYIAFHPEQIKNTDNSSPTSDPDIRYSLSDNEGRELTREQQSYFKDSKIRDEIGQLKVMYHGTPNGNFAVFRNGGYFTDNRAYAERYMSPSSSSISSGKVATDPKVFEVYLDIKKPFDLNDPEARNIYINEYIKGGNAMGINPYLSDAEYANIKTIDWTEGEDLRDFLIDNGYDYDGLVLDEGGDGGYGDAVVSRGTSYVVFKPEQVKSVDNRKPTSDPDIRHSLSEEGEAHPLNRAMQYVETTPAQEDVAPAQAAPVATAEQPKIDSLYEELDKVLADYAPMTEAETAFESDRLASLDDADAPPVPEASYPGESMTPADPFEDRDIVDVGNRKVNAYMYENPEVKPFFQTEALGMLEDLRNSTKGEKWFNSQVYYDTSGEAGWGGTKRSTTDDIAYLLDNWHYTYEQIEKGLNAIIEDNGAENNAVSKRIEFALDERLRNGYRGAWGEEYPPNQEYINLLNEKQINEYSEEAFASFMENADQYAPPVEEDIAPVAVEKPAAKAKSEPRQAYEAIHPPRVEHEHKMVRVDKTPEQQQIAKILTEEPTPENRKSRAWARFKANVLDKGAVFEDLSLKTKNRELMGKWNFIMSSEARAQRLMGSGSGGVKSLNAIREEVGNSGKTEQFYEYLYHKHNVDRMQLEQRYEDTPNKPVFGNSVTAEMSQGIADRYEKANPEFKRYARDVYGYMNHLRQLLVSNGVISQDTADLWADMYPHYVPIRRAGDTGLNINVPLDTGKTGVNAPIKKATGGSRDIMPLFDTMAQRTVQTYKAIAKNSFGVELKNALGTTVENAATSVDDVIDSIDTQEGLLQEGKNGMNPTFTVFEDGEKVTFEITKDMYDALKPTSEGMAYTNKVLNTASNLHRGLLTEYNPVFMLTNAVKDVQDMLVNSQHPIKTYAKLPESYAQMMRKGYWYTEYMENGGDQNTYFDRETNTFDTGNKGLAKLLDIPPLSTISKLNNIIEMSPRLAEYIASREAGRSIEVSMLDAARVTTNFAAGGNLTKLLNRNGATFLNASVQGAMQQVRNVREAKMNGLKGWASLATKFAVAGLPALLLNGFLWGDDDDYEELSDYVKQNYYIVGKFGDGQFVRIPKGRTLAVIQSAIEQIGNAATGNDEADLNAFLELTISNLAPNNPLESNIVAPIMQVINNETWYGEDLVPTRLQDLPAAEQYDESTDAISKWLGETLNYSPVKINYLLDQYSGGLGDTVLPMLTPEAESGDNSLLGNMLAPLKSKFTTDSVMNNQNVSDFYELKDELATNAKASTATDEDVLMSKYINSVNAELSALYAQKREIQNSNLPDDAKYEQVREIQKQIVALTKDSLDAYKDVSISGSHATVGNRHYRPNEDGEWQKMTGDQVTKYNATSAAGDSPYATDGSNHYRLYEKDGEREWVKISDEQLKKQNEVTSGLGISAADYWGNKEEYDYAYEHPENYAVAKAVGGYASYRSYSSELYDIKADKDANGKSISGSRKEKVIDYINNLDADYGTKIILFKSEYTADDTYNQEIIDYLNSRDDISYEETVTILKELGFTVLADGTVQW